LVLRFDGEGDHDEGDGFLGYAYDWLAIAPALTIVFVLEVVATQSAVGVWAAQCELRGCLMLHSQKNLLQVHPAPH